MNTRGLTELVILQVGVQLNVIDPQMFTMLVLMAIITTVMTGPLLNVFYPARILQRDIEEAEQQALGTRGDYTVLVITGLVPAMRRCWIWAATCLVVSRPRGWSWPRSCTAHRGLRSPEGSGWNLPNSPARATGCGRWRAPRRRAG